MLNTNKNISLSGNSIIGGIAVVMFNANISTDGGAGSVNKTIIKQETYDANRTECRADIAAFSEAVYEIEDEIIADKEAVV